MVKRKSSRVFDMTPKDAYEKCRKKDKRILELEKIISTDSYYSYRYARDIIKEPFELGEDVISKDPQLSHCYARDIIGGPWKRGEDIISKDAERSYRYAYIIIGGPFEKCHSIIFDSDYKNDYIIFLKSINYDLNKISEWLI